MKKRMISLMLAVVMLLGTIPMTALAADCDHASTTAVVRKNDSGNHVEILVCDDCETEVSEQLKKTPVLDIDFKDVAKAASEHTWWGDFETVATADGDETTRIGGAIKGNSMTDSQRAAYGSLRAWLSENYGWTINEGKSYFDYAFGGNRLYLSADEDVVWGLSWNSYYRDYEMTLDVDVPVAGEYDLSFLVSKVTGDSKDFPVDGWDNTESGTIDVLVNGELVLDEYDFTGTDTEKVNVGTVELKAGTNLITFWSSTNYVGSTTATPCWHFNLCSLTLSGAETCADVEAEEVATSNGDGTHTAFMRCVDCHETVAYDAAAINLDFKASMKNASEQSFWAGMRSGTTADGNDAKVIGVPYSAGSDTEEALAAYNEMNAWLIENEGWSFDANGPRKGRRVFLSADDDLLWSVSNSSYMVGDDFDNRADMGFIVNTDASGYYDLTLHIVTSDTDSQDYVVEDPQIADSGGGYADVVVNGETIAEDVSFVGTMAKKSVRIGNVYLQSGSNTVLLHSTMTVWGDNRYAFRNNLNLSGMSFAPTGKLIANCYDEDADGYCDLCGYGAESETPEIEKFDIPGANMTLGNDLKMNFMVKKSDMKDGYKAYVTQGDGEPVELELWSYNAQYYAASYSVAAKEMTDVLSCEIYDADGNLVSNPFTRTVAQYAMTLLNNASQKASLKSVIVDMLNYGTEAQKYFKYNTEALANADVSEAQQTQFATGDVECNNVQDKIQNCAGANLSLEDSILLNVFFSGVSGKDISKLSATIEFVDYKGNAVTANVGAEKYGSMAKVVVNQIVLADAKRPVNVKLFDADGTKIGEGVESVESYVARNLTNESTGAINMAIIKFATSAYNYLGGTN